MTRFKNIKQYPFNSREKLEVLAYNNPRAFLEMIENNKEFRENFQYLLQDFNHNDMIQLAMVFQGRIVREPVTLAPMLVDQMPKDFKTWMRDEQDYLSSNKLHELGSFSLFQEKQRAMKEMAEYHRQVALQKKREKYLREKEEKEKLQQQQQILELVIQEELKRIHGFINHLSTKLFADENLTDFLKTDFADSYRHFSDKMSKLNLGANTQQAINFLVLFDASIKADPKKALEILLQHQFLISEEFRKTHNINNVDDFVAKYQQNPDILISALADADKKHGKKLHQALKETSKELKNLSSIGNVLDAAANGSKASLHNAIEQAKKHNVSEKIANLTVDKIRKNVVTAHAKQAEKITTQLNFDLSILEKTKTESTNTTDRIASLEDPNKTVVKKDLS
jgi:hypothetical protein